MVLPFLFCCCNWVSNVCVCKHTHTHTHLTYIYIYIYIVCTTAEHTHTHTYTYIHTYIHTYIQQQNRKVNTINTKHRPTLDTVPYISCPYCLFLRICLCGILRSELFHLYKWSFLNTFPHQNSVSNPRIAPRRRWKDYIKTDLQEVGYGGHGGNQYGSG
jgi:hypothetical protein